MAYYIKLLIKSINKDLANHFFMIVNSLSASKLDRERKLQQKILSFDKI